jgi:multiple sugar transport system ATP-binding protein
LGNTDGITVQIVVVEPTGLETLIIAKAAGQEIVCVFRERVTTKPGEIIHVTANPVLVHLLQQDTGQRL